MNSISKLSQKIIDSEAFVTNFRLLEAQAAKKRIFELMPKIPEGIVENLLLQASAIAFSDTVAHKHIAQKILAILHELYDESDIVNYAIQIVSARLGNFPVVSEESQVFKKSNLFKKLTGEEELDFVIDPDIAAGLLGDEEISRFRIAEKTFHFNIYQNEILEALRDKSLISFSAPTSFGKSFIVRHYIARRYASNDIKRCLIIVPTKALIDDFFEDFVDIRKRLFLNYALYTHARSVEGAEEKSIFILTQERLSFLISQNPDFIKTFDLVYCDEAHYISRGYRGFVLREVLKNLIELCQQRDGSEEKTKYIFSSPIIKNPDYYRNKLFPNLEVNETYHKEIQYSPVEKNIHLISKEATQFTYYLLHDLPANIEFTDQIEEIGRKEFDTTQEHNSGNNIPKDIQIVLQSNIKERTIFFTTSPLFAHKYALFLSQQLPHKHAYIDEINDLARYIQDHFDKSFGIAGLLKKGIGLHYGPMPIGLRRAMVDLFEKGALDYLICTATLLEGVNLPAKNICLFSDIFGGETGKEKHDALSFWNLLGRAGRITYGLSGNVYCIEKNISKYQELLDNKAAEIEDPEKEVTDNATPRNYLVEAITGTETEKYKYTKARSRGDIEYLIFELFTKSNPELLLKGFDNRTKRRLLDGIAHIRTSLVIPPDLVNMNPGIDPRLQNQLYTNMMHLNKGSLERYFTLASNPFSLRANNFMEILAMTSENLMWPMYSDIDRISKRLTQWIHEAPLSAFIQQRLQHLPQPNETDIDSQIKYIEAALITIRNLEQDFSYKTPKYLKCFFDIAANVANRKGINVEPYKEQIDALLFSLECGVSEPVGKYLYEQGVSRPVAIKANKLIKSLAVIPLHRDFFKQAEVTTLLKSGLSRIAYKEVLDHLG